jgi:hypothetical protein
MHDLHWMRILLPLGDLLTSRDILGTISQNEQGCILERIEYEVSNEPLGMKA